MFNCQTEKLNKNGDYYLKDVRVFIEDIEDSIIKIEEYTKSDYRGRILRNTLIQDAVFRRLEIKFHIPFALNIR
jgi:hypothetical protein